MTQEAKTLGECIGCDNYGSLTMQHIRLVPELDSYKIPLCDDCHKIVTRYEDEVLKALSHLKEKK